jgi:hypothetical protein
MRMIRALLKVVTTAAFAAVVLVVSGPVASARILPDPLVAPSPTVVANPPPAAPASAAASGSTALHIALAVAAALVTVVLTLVVARLLTAHRNAGRRAVVS